MKTYENFITDLFKPKMTAEKFTAFLIKFINSILYIDNVSYSCIHIKNTSLISHHIGSTELEEYVIEIDETDNKDIVTIEFSELHDPSFSGTNKKIKIIINELENIQEFIKNTIEPIVKDKIDIIIRYTPTNRVKYMINISDIEKVIPNINKENYEIFLDQKKYNL